MRIFECIVTQSKMVIWKYRILIRSIEFVIVRYVCKSVFTFHCTVLRIKCIPSNKLHLCSQNWICDKRLKFFLKFFNFKDWGIFNLFAAHFVFASVTWGTFSFSFYSLFLIVFYFVINDCLSAYEISGFLFLVGFLKKIFQ